MLIDLLDRLEWYQGMYPRWQAVIDILDRSLPYDDPDGDHIVDSIHYAVTTYRTSETGKEQVAEENQVIVLLEGEELFSLQGKDQVLLSSVFTEGRFIYVRKGERVKSEQAHPQAGMVRKVTFYLP